MCLLSVAMSCGITTANYTHCPLKKRPVFIFDDLDGTEDVAATYNFQSEPENLSTKSADLQLTCKKTRDSRRVPPTCYSYPDKSQVGTSLTKVSQQNYQLPRVSSSETNKVSSLSEKCCNTPPLRKNHPSTYYPSVLDRDEPADDFQTYFCDPPTVSLERQFVSHHDQDSSCVKNYRPYVSSFTKSCTFYQTSDSCGLSPTSSTSSPLHNSYLATSPLNAPETPEDLSLSGGVVSSKSSRNKRTGYGKDKRTVSKYQCFCYKSYQTFLDLSNHQDLCHSSQNVDYTGKKTFSCGYCEKVYLTSGALKMHIRTHTLPCKCVICGKAFSRPWLLQGHIRTHTGEKPFPCNICERAFADRSNLRAHLQTHSEVKKYSCSNCGKSFSRTYLLNRHQDGGCSLFSESSEDLNID